jgi:hypothetical protein
MMTPRGVAATAAMIAVGGLAGMVAGMAAGNTWLAVAGFAVTMGANLIEPLADWWQTTAAVEAIRREHHEQEAIATPQRCVEPQLSSREEAEAKLKAYYARVINAAYTGSGQFRERVSAEDEPGWERVH